MRWQPPSERVQFALASPLVIPAAVFLAAVILPLVPLFIASDWWTRRQIAKGWHRWFAWRPVRFDGFWYDMPSQWMWLETVERRRNFANWERRPLSATRPYRDSGGTRSAAEQAPVPQDCQARGAALTAAQQERQP